MSNLLTSLSLWTTLLDTVPDPVRYALQTTADRWFDWLLISSGVVAAGVVAEIWEATITLKRWWRLRRGKEVNEPNEKSWAIPVSYLGLLLVIAGVVGEGVFEARVSNADTALREHDDQILAQAQHEAGDAKTSAEGAANAAVRTNDELGKAEKREDAVARKAEELHRELNQANERAENLHKENLNLQEAISPRIVEQGESANELQGLKGIVFRIQAI